ncbi:capsule-associated protein CAP1, partial [Physocladia obscura]
IGDKLVKIFQKMKKVCKWVFVTAVSLCCVALLAFLAALETPPASTIDNLYEIPPPDSVVLVEFTKLKNCSSDIDHYAQIYRDFAYWIKTGSISSAVFDKVLKKGNMHLNGGETLFITYYPLNASLHGYDTRGTTGPWGLDGINRIWDPVAQFLKTASNKSFTAMVSSMDYPRFVTADTPKSSLYTYLWPESYTNSKDMFDRISYFRDRYNSSLPFNQSDYLTYTAGGRSMLQLHGYFQNDNTLFIKNIEAPIFSHCKVENYLDMVLPLWYHVSSSAGTHDPVPWEKKKNVVFWRGATTGGDPVSKKPWRQYHRLRLIEWARKYALVNPDNIFDAGEDGAQIPNPNGLSVDVGIHKIHNADKTTAKVIAKTYGIKKSVNIEKILEFKYLIVVDGHTWPSRLLDYLQTNSVILFNGIFTDYFSWMLEPFVHYVPFKSDYSDLEERLQWLMNHDADAQRISMNARNLLERIHTIEHMQCYTGLAMLEYSNLFVQG